MTDILWRNYATGDVDAWSMSGTSAIGVVDLITLPDPSWHLVGTSDFNRDGHADMLWRNQTTGDVHAWLMQGTTVSQAIAVCCLPDPNWQLTTTGDVNNDGSADLLWHHQATGGNVAWVMSGTNARGFRCSSSTQSGKWLAGSRCGGF
ncbi:MAG: VCBS repeat-containing protein [Coleofasciculaceae cyanobacterium SM2_3_26]|nr:VCBS repeat-containing protein [Coleofasciculaceae cyanobacterium SM2_3_26]